MFVWLLLLAGGFLLWLIGMRFWVKKLLAADLDLICEIDANHALKGLSASFASKFDAYLGQELSEVFEFIKKGELKDKQDQVWHVKSLQLIFGRRVLFFSAVKQDASAWIQHVPLPVCVLDASGQFAQINKSAQVYLHEGWHGKRVEDYIAKARIKDWAKLFANASIAWASIEVLWKGMNTVKLFACKNENNEITLLIYDLIEFETIKQQAQKAQHLQAMGALTTGVVHDFNNILAAIDGFAALLVDSVPNAKQDVANIQKAVVRAREMIKQLLQLSAQKDTVISNVAKAIQEALPLLNMGCQHQCKIIMQANLQQSLPVHFTQGQLLQILTNLVLNAKEANAKKVHLEVAARHVQGAKNLKSGVIVDGMYVVVKVEDNGDGMTSQVEDKLLKGFFTTKTSGSGVGLVSICRMLTMHGGGMDFHSDTQGTVFEVYLPVKVAVASHTKIDRSRTILLVEDDSLIRELTARILRKEGYEVLEAENGAQALEMMSKKVNLVLTDAIMPKMNGVQLVKELLKGKFKGKIVLMSGVPAEELTEQLPGDVLVLTKPVIVQDLCKKLDRLFADKRSA